MTGFLFQAFVYLAAAVIAVPVAKRLGLGSVLGYLIAGIVIGPVIGLVGSETQDIQHFAEFGVVMMLFLVGLELEPRQLWEMRDRLLGLGGMQVTVTAAAVMGISMLFGLSWSISLAIGLVFSLSSTAIVLQTLGEKGLMKSDGGQASFSVLLFQDIAVIPMLALVPLLAIPELLDPRIRSGARRRTKSDRRLSRLAGCWRYCFGDRCSDSWWPLSDPPAVPFHRQRRVARSVYRNRPANGNRHRASYDACRAFTCAWHFPRRCGLGQQ